MDNLLIYGNDVYLSTGQGGFRSFSCILEEIEVGTYTDLDGHVDLTIENPNRGHKDF